MTTSKVGADDWIASGRGADLPAMPRRAAGQAQPVELNALLAKQYNEPPAIVGGGILPRGGLLIFGGPPKRGKSLALQQQALARSLGWPWLGFSTTPGRTLVLQAEIPEPQLQARVATQSASLATPIPEGAVHFVTERRLRLDRPEGLRVVRHLIEGLEPDLLQVDPIARFMSGDENSTREMGRLVAGLDELIQSYGVAVELCHHTAKPSADDAREGGQRLRGSSALFAAADSVLLLDRDGADAFRLTFELRHGPEPAPLRLQRTPSLWLEPAGPPADLLAVAAIVERLPLRYAPLIQSIEADLGVKERTAQTLLARAKRAGFVVSEGGVYRATASYRNGGVAVDGNPDE